MQRLEIKIRNRIKELLDTKAVDAVIAYAKGEFFYDVTPNVFDANCDIDNFIYDCFCGINLSKYLVSKISNGKKYAVLLKPCDTYSMNQLITEHRVNRDNIYIIGIGCQGHLDIDKIKNKGISGVLSAVDNGKTINVKSIYGDTEVNKSEVLLTKCQSCKGNSHMIYDELIGEEMQTPESGGKFDLVSKLEAMTTAERYAYWRVELSKCIRCNACRNICPACTCRNCVFDNNKSKIATKTNSNEAEEKMFHIIRAFHVAGRCTDCGECSRVCPQGIPLHLLNRKFIKDINEFYGDYQAGSSAEQRNPLVNYTKEDIEPTTISDREGN